MKKIIHIKWMHCISCEILLDKELKKVSGATILMINHKKWLLEIDFKKESDYKKIVKIIEENNFKVIEKSEIAPVFDSTNMLLNIIALLFVVILFIASKIFDFYSIIPSLETINFLWALFIGLIASLSTCLAITWWIILGFSKYFDQEKSFAWHLKVQSSFQFWRILWFFVFGWLLGLIGQTISINFTVTAILTIFISLILIYMWLNILGLLPSITKLWLHMPKSFVSKIEKLGKPKYAPIVWALTFFLPCWFTQTMQLLAVSSWSFWLWGLVMMFFAIWTFPVLFSLWLWSSYFNDRNYTYLNKFIAAIIIFFWVFSLSNSYKLINYSFISLWWENKSITDITWEKNNAKLEEVRVSHNGYQTVPSILNLKAGWNYKIIITPTSNWLGCMSTQAIPKLSNKVSYVKKWEDIIYEIYDVKPWTYDIVCASMWMNQWQIIVK